MKNIFDKKADADMSKAEISPTKHYSDTLISDFCEYLKKLGLSPGTIHNYSYSVRLYFTHYNILSIENIQSYRLFLLDNYKPSTVNTRILGMNRFLNYLQKNNLSTYENESIPESDNNLVYYRLRPILEQRQTYLDTVISQKNYERLKRCLKKDENYFWYFIIRFLASTGARVSELRQVKMEDLQLGYLDIYSKGGKIRRLFFPRSLCNEAIPYFSSLGIDSGFIFLTRRNTCICTRAIEMQLKAIAKRYKINPATMYPHSFRHRYAINFLKRFNDISLLADLLGHDSIETTRIYLMKSSEEQRTVIDRVVTW